MTLRSAKCAATRREHHRVYINMCMPPRDITIEHDGHHYVRRSWQGVGRFGWGRWEAA